jgi:hypothetical protein
MWFFGWLLGALIVSEVARNSADTTDQTASAVPPAPTHATPAIGVTQLTAAQMYASNQSTLLIEGMAGYRCRALDPGRNNGHRWRKLRGADRWQRATADRSQTAARSDRISAWRVRSGNAGSSKHRTGISFWPAARLEAALTDRTDHGPVL